MGQWGFKPCMITLGYDPFQSVNHGVPGSSPGEGAQIKKRSLRPLFRLKTTTTFFNETFFVVASFYTF